VHDKTIRRILACFAAVSAILVVVAVLAVRNIGRSESTSDWVNHTHTVILRAEALRASLYSGDGSWHTYVLTGDERDLAASREAFGGATDDLGILDALTRQEPDQHAQVAALRSRAEGRVEFIERVVAERQAGRMGAVKGLLSADAGGTVMKDLERGIGRLKDDELALLTERDSASFLQAQATRWTVWTGVTLDVVLLAGAAWLIRDDLAARRLAVDTLRAANENLEARVRERTAELVAANEKLSSENLERQWANQALEHQLRYNQLIIDSISDLVFVVTKALKISRVNPAVVRFTGLEPASLVNEPLAKVVRLDAPAAGGDAPMLDPALQAMRDGRDLRDQPAVAEDKRGRKTAARFTLYPLRDRDKVVGAIVTLQLGAPPGGPEA
jgi:CHASE3 domain sensor protein